MRSEIKLAGQRFKLARQDLVPTGARRWRVSQRPSQPGDPSASLFADWQIDSPNLFSSEDGEQGFLGIDWCDGADSRWHDRLMLGPLLNTITLSTYDQSYTESLLDTSSAIADSTLFLDGSPVVANANGQEILQGGGNVFAYIIRGQSVVKVKLSDMSVVGPGHSLPEAATSILATRTATAVREVSVGMNAQPYEVMTNINTSVGADSWVINDDGALARILGQAPAVVVGLTGQQIRENILTGAVTMASPNWQDVATIEGEPVTMTGFALDGGLWVIGTSNGPYILDSNEGDFFPIIPEIDNDEESCRAMATWFSLGVLIPLRDGTRYQAGGSGQSWGVETFHGNRSPVQGFATGHAGTTKGIYQAVYNETTGDTYLIYWRPPRGDDSRNPILSPFVVAKIASLRSDYLRYIGRAFAIRTNPTLMGGIGSNAWYATLGRTTQEPDDTNYRFNSTGTAYLTELRRYSGMIKDLTAIEFESDDCDSTHTLTFAFAVDGEDYETLSGVTDYETGDSLNGVVNSDGHQRLLFVDDAGTPLSWATGRRIKPKLAFAGTSTQSPQVTNGTVRLYYRLRPLRTTVQDFSLVLDASDRTISERELETKLQETFGDGPVPIEDPDGNTYYLRVDDVVVTEVMDKGESPTGKGAPVRIAALSTSRWPTVEGE